MTQPAAIPTESATPALTVPAPPVIPAEAQEFAEANAFARYLPAVLAMTRRTFPLGDMTVELSEDHVTEGDRFILFGVDITGLTVEELVAAQTAWARGLFDHCPPAHVHFFRYSLRARA